ncbi:hypothetical protein [Flavobacterium sp. LB1P62]|uniref:hypothetical protein n=1 Tax=Flavobacterium sp. LB1P62 TaxID=3401715 RepID=UPI003AAC4D9B
MIVNPKITSFFLYTLFVIIFCKSNALEAQVQNNGDLYISDNSVVYSGLGLFDFGSGSTITSRTKLDYGVLSFAKGATWIGASDIHYIDGYAQTLNDTAFILPIGQSGFYAPIQVIPLTSGGVDAAYFRSAPSTISTVLDASISSISSVEYWDIKSAGVNAALSLSWGSSSSISALTKSSISSLTIVGWDGSKWVPIPSTIDVSSLLGEKSSLVSGSISSNTIVDLSLYSAFSLGSSSKPTLRNSSSSECTVFINESRLIIQSSSRITGIAIYDITGKKIVSEKLDGEYKYNMEFSHEEAVYIAKIELDNGVSVATKKLINRMGIR